MGKQHVILVVEDDPALRRMFRVALTFGGFRVQEAADGMEAIRRIDSDQPDLVVLDLGLPALDGLAVHQDISAQAHTRHIPVVIVTGSGANLDHLDVPCVLRKPITPDRLVEAVRSCLASGAPAVGS